MTTGEWLDEWFAGKNDLRRTTRRYYASNIRVYLKPRLGDIPLDRPRVAHLTAMFEWIEATNHTRRRPVGRATMLQIRGTLRSSLSDAAREGLVTRNVAKGCPAAVREEDEGTGLDRRPDSRVRRRVPAARRRTPRQAHQAPQAAGPGHLQGGPPRPGHHRSWSGHRPRPTSS
jgi:hypothetical protein